MRPGAGDLLQVPLEDRGALRGGHLGQLAAAGQLALHDFRRVLDSPGWRTYLAPHAAFSGLADGDLRDQVQAALAHAHAGHTALIARAWHQIAALLGYRLRPETGAGFDTLATLLSATMRGLVIAALSTPEVATRSSVAQPFGAAGEEPWSLPALAMASLAMGFLEPDPGTEWDERRLAAIHDALNAWAAGGHAGAPTLP